LSLSFEKAFDTGNLGKYEEEEYFKRWKHSDVCQIRSSKTLIPNRNNGNRLRGL